LASGSQALEPTTDGIHGRWPGLIDQVRMGCS
jgi:hypothetical protein